VLFRSADLETTQPSVSKTGVNHYLETGELASVNPEQKGNPILVTKLNGKLHIHDGNHRANAWILAGETEIEALVYDLDKTAKDNPEVLEKIYDGQIPEPVKQAIEAGKIPDDPYLAKLYSDAGGNMDNANTKAMGDMVALAANPKGQTLKHKELAKELGVSPKQLQNMGSSELIDKVSGAGKPEAELFAGILKTADEKQAAASKASKLSTAKKKILAGKAPSSSEQAVINDLTPEEKANWDATIAEARGKVDPAAELAAVYSAADPDTQKQMLQAIGGEPDMFDAGELSNPELFVETAKLLDDAFDQPLADSLSTVQKLLKEKAKAASKIAATTAPSPTAEPEPAALYVPPLGDLEKVQDLPGSTRPYLAKDPTTGALYVVKSTAKGITQAHLKSEATADAIYRAAGLNVPASTQPDAKTKVAQFLEGGQTLAEWKQGKSKKQIDAMNAELRKGFVADALLANWDVAGASNDNILVVAGKPVRIDNGGALGFRAQGGKKPSFYDKTGVVAELESLRDPSQAPMVSQFTQGITQREIDDQTVDLLRRRGKIIDAARKAGAPKADIEALNRRLDWLEDQLPADQKQNIAASAVAPGQIPEDLSDRLDAGRRGAGTSIIAGNDEIEDQQLKVWRERNTSGDLLIKADADLTITGANRLQKMLADAGVSTADRASNRGATRVDTGPDDPFSQALQAAAKTLATHADDKAFNTTTIANLADQGATLAQYAASGDKAKIDMAKHYQPIWDKLMNVDKTATAAKIKKQIPWVEGWVYEKAKYEKKTKARRKASDAVMVNGWEVTRPTDFAYTVKQLDPDGILRDTGTVNDLKGTPAIPQHGQVYRLRKGDVEVTFQAFSASKPSSERNFQGSLRINVNTANDHDGVQQALRTLEELGIQPAPTEAQQELLYLHKGIALRGDDTGAMYQSIIKSNDSDEAKVTRIKDWAESQYGVKLPRDRSGWGKDYNPEGTLPSNGSGQRSWRRWDVSGKEIDRITKDKVLFHSGDVRAALRGWLENGGNATSTQERVRTGVHVGYKGASSDTDMDVGGGNYLYASHTTKHKAMGRAQGFLFKGRNLARLDIRSDRGDSYGRWEAAQSRRRTLDEMARETAVSIGANTGLMKNGINLFDEIEVINAGLDRDNIIKMLREEFGLKKWPDGRSLEDVVVK